MTGAQNHWVMNPDAWKAAIEKVAHRIHENCDGEFACECIDPDQHETALAVARDKAAEAFAIFAVFEREGVQGGLRRCGPCNQGDHKGCARTKCQCECVPVPPAGCISQGVLAMTAQIGRILKTVSDVAFWAAVALTVGTGVWTLVHLL